MFLKILYEEAIQKRSHNSLTGTFLFPGSRSAGPVGKAQNLVIFNLTSATAYTFEVYAYNDGCGGMEPSPTFSSYNACTGKSSK